MELWSLYALMKKSRLFEQAVTQLWNEGLISGEMHLGTGEEAIIAGVVSQLQTGDAMAVDHRGSAAFLMRGVDPRLILREMLGKSNGLCGGKGGHMHLFSKEHLAATSGIVGAGGPVSVGFGLASNYLRPGSISIAFFGEGAMNQGMLMESIHLASSWQLPVIFVCKDDGWAITTQTKTISAGEIEKGVRWLGADYVQVDGLDVAQVWQAARQCIEKARRGEGPSFLHARCVHLEGHFLGFLLLRLTRNPVKEMPGILIPLFRAFLRSGGGTLRERAAGMKMVFSASLATMRDPRQNSMNDPLVRTQAVLKSADPARLDELEDRIQAEISTILAEALSGVEA